MKLKRLVEDFSQQIKKFYKPETCENVTRDFVSYEEAKQFCEENGLETSSIDNNNSVHYTQVYRYLISKIIYNVELWKKFGKQNPEFLEKTTITIEDPEVTDSYNLRKWFREYIKDKNMPSYIFIKEQSSKIESVEYEKIPYDIRKQENEAMIISKDKIKNRKLTESAMDEREYVYEQGYTPKFDMTVIVKWGVIKDENGEDVPFSKEIVGFYQGEPNEGDLEHYKDKGVKWIDADTITDIEIARQKKSKGVEESIKESDDAEYKKVYGVSQKVDGTKEPEYWEAEEPKNPKDWHLGARKRTILDKKEWQKRQGMTESADDKDFIEDWIEREDTIISDLSDRLGLDSGYSKELGKNVIWLDDLSDFDKAIEKIGRFASKSSRFEDSEKVSNFDVWTDLGTFNINVINRKLEGHPGFIMVRLDQNNKKVRGIYPTNFKVENLKSTNTKINIRESLKESADDHYYYIRFEKPSTYSGYDFLRNSFNGNALRFSSLEEAREYIEKYCGGKFDKYSVCNYKGEPIEPTNTKINIRESLNKIDLDTDNQFDLRNLYDSAVGMNKEDKIKLAKMISMNESYRNMYNYLKKFI